MVSDFIDEHNGYLTRTDAEYEQGKQTYPDLQQQAYKLLKYGESINTGLDYWNGGIVEWWTGFFFLVFDYL